MKVEYINPFIASTHLVFSTMLGCKVTRNGPVIKENSRPPYEISGIIGLSGKATGTVVLSLGQDVALAATGAMLKQRFSEINDDVLDAVGELTNIIAGRAKEHLAQFALSVGLPRVITGTSHCVEFPSASTPISIPFDSTWGPFAVEVGLVEQPAVGVLAT